MPYLFTISSTAPFDAVNSALGEAASQVQTNAATAIGTVLPYALGIAGLIIVIAIGFKVLKKFTSR